MRSAKVFALERPRQPRIAFVYMPRRLARRDVAPGGPAAFAGEACGARANPVRSAALAAASDMLQATRKRAAEGARACAVASKRRKQ